MLNHGNVVLIKERGSHRFSLPGGGVERSDAKSSLAAVAREIREETGLRPTDARFLFHHRTPDTRHSVYVVERFSGNVHLQRKELSDFKWWDGKGELPLSYSTRAILMRSGFIKRSLLKRILGGILHK